MCLDSITKKFKHPNDHIEVGYKIVRKASDTCFKTIFKPVFKPVDFWLGRLYHCHEHPEIKTNDEQTSYKPGFHIYLSLDDTQCLKRQVSFVYDSAYTVIEVIVWDIIAYGTERHYNDYYIEKDAEVCVAKNIRVIKEII